MDKFSEIKEKILPFILPHGVKRVAIFGSFARGEEAAQSDIDLLITLKPVGQRPPVGLKWFSLEEELSRVLGRKVDLVSEKALSPYIRPYVQKEMVILYDEG
jgi:predicted nucleotidyltransferase